MKTLYIRNIDTYRQILSTDETNNKTIEIRKESGFISSLIIGETIIIQCDSSSCTRRIISINIYNSLRKLFENIDLSKANRNIRNIDDAIKYYSTYYNNVNDTYYSIYITRGDI